MTLRSPDQIRSTWTIEDIRSKDELGQVFIYELQAPLSAEDFFKDDLLSMLLADSLGQIQYDELKQEFVKPAFTYANAKEVTKSLLDVFTVKRIHYSKIHR